MSDHLRRIYDLERQLPERNFAKDHSYEEWLVQQGSTSIEGCPHTEIELQKVCERCGYREPVGDAPDISKLARTAAILVDKHCEVKIIREAGDEDEIRELADIIEEVLAGSDLQTPSYKELLTSNAELVRTLSTRADREREMLAEVEAYAFTRGYERCREDAAKVARDKGATYATCIKGQDVAQEIADDVASLTPKKSEDEAMGTLIQRSNRN